MRRSMMVLAVGFALTLAIAPGRAEAQVILGDAPLPYRVNSSIGLPDLYGTSWGVASYGSIRTYSTFSSPYGGGYGYGYPPYSYLPGWYGVGLWRPGFVSPGYVYGASYYRTFPVPYRPLVPSYGPPLGYYAPGFGPPAYYGW